MGNRDSTPRTIELTDEQIIKKYETIISKMKPEDKPEKIPIITQSVNNNEFSLKRSSDLPLSDKKPTTALEHKIYNTPDNKQFDFQTLTPYLLGGGAILGLVFILKNEQK